MSLKGSKNYGNLFQYFTTRTQSVFFDKNSLGLAVPCRYAFSAQPGVGGYINQAGIG